jgi:hypothetical protein
MASTTEKDLFTEPNIKGESEPKQDQAFYLSSLLLKCFSLIPCIYNRIIQYGKKALLSGKDSEGVKSHQIHCPGSILRLRVAILSKVRSPQLCDICL